MPKNSIKNKYGNIKHILPIVGFVFIILVGLLGSAGEARAVDMGTCDYVDMESNSLHGENQTAAQCEALSGNKTSWKIYPATATTAAGAVAPTGIAAVDQAAADRAATAPKSEFEKRITEASCMSGTSVINPFSAGCIQKVFYWLFHDIPAFLLYVSAYFFNILLSVSLSTDLFRSPFVVQAWGIVRDLSNIFFLLILLYIAIKLILGLGGSDVKKMIVQVVIIALLINFSMFFTQVIIDSSNILALVFYNKVNVSTKNPNGKERDYSSIGNEKDVAGGLVNSFDPTKMIGQDFFTQAAKKFDANGVLIPNEKQDVPLGIVLSIILLSGAIMGVAIYVFFMSGFFFLGRLIELWILLIFSPFAFMSSTVPQLSGISDIGWKAWFSRLLSSSFMAPIFMFFLYFIFMLIASPIFGAIIPKSTTNEGVTGMIKIILGVMLPSILICVLLLKAKNYAKKGSGQIGEMIGKVGGTIGGLAVAAAGGAVLGGAAMLGRGTVGHVAGNLAESNRMRDWAARSKFGAGVLKATSGVAASSFDARGVKIMGKDLSGATGMNLGKAQEGGFTKARADKVKRREEFANKLLDTSDYGKAQLTRGGMTANQANRVVNQMAAGGMPLMQALGHQAALMGGGMSMADVTVASRHLDEAKRNDFANRIQNRNMTNRIAANKIRKSATTAAQNAQLARLTAALAVAQAQNAPQGNAPANPPTNPPATPAPCWVAEVLYGINDKKTHAARLWAATNINWFTKIYRQNGESWAEWLTIHKWAQPIVKPIWDIMAMKGQLLAVKIRTNNSFINEKFNYLLEKVK